MPDPTPNQKVEAYTRHKAGHHAIKRHGKYECTALVEAALESVHAKSLNDFDQPANGDYIWGSPIPHLDDLRPGDILQFRNYLAEGKTDFGDGGNAATGLLNSSAATINTAP